MSRGWRIELDRDWDVLGPFPIHAREQHFLSPAYPLDLTAIRFPTSLTHTAYASWSRTTADPSGIIHVAHPSVPWDQIRTTEGWAGLQHLNVLRSWLSVYPPSDLGGDTSEPLLCAELLQGAFFTILPPSDSPERKFHVPVWHHGDIYKLGRTPLPLVKFPVSPARNGEGTKYEVIVCAPYEIRLFGDPSAYSSPHPIPTLNFAVSLQFSCSPTPVAETGGIQCSLEDVPLRHVPALSMAPHVVDGTPFGDAAGVGVQCLDFEPSKDRQNYWSVVRACLVPTIDLPTSLSVTLNEATVRIAPTQTRVIPLRLCVSPLERIPESVSQLDIELTCLPLRQAASDHAPPDVSDEKLVNQRPFILRITLPLRHVSLWTREKYVAIQASYFFARSMPAGFSVIPPIEPFGDSSTISGQHDKINPSGCIGSEPVLALHGAGVDILTQSFWAESLLRQKYAWVVMPQGGTPWGLDWHGPSAADAFATIPALSRILSPLGSGRWVEWGFDPDTRVILMGHSNGGQGAWYMASRYPDRVCGVVPAAGYIKSQAYVSWSMSRFAHFVDPALRAVLDSSLTPDDNDLFLGNLVGKPVLALNGGADDNVPPWHTREQVGILKTWDPNADVTYHEDPGRPHWYSDILSNERVQAFLDRLYFSPSTPLSTGDPPHGLVNPNRKAMNFTLTVAIPAESGSLNGWQIHALKTPGLLGRLHVMTTPGGHVSVRTTNVAVFSLKSTVRDTTPDGLKKVSTFVIDGNHIPDVLDDASHTILFATEATSTWKILPLTDPLATINRLRIPPQRLQSILSTHAPLTLLVPSLASCPELTAALRIAHALQLFHALDARIVSVPEVEVEIEAKGKVQTPHTSTGIREGNLVVIGCADSPVVQHWLERAGGMWSYVDGCWRIRGATRFDRPSSAILFCQPHPFDVRGIALFLQSTDTSGLERAVRLFPIRTGVLAPDWLVVDGRADTIGAAGVQGAGVYGWTFPDTHDSMGKWVWNERMSWLD